MEARNLKRRRIDLTTIAYIVDYIDEFSALCSTDFDYTIATIQTSRKMTKAELNMVSKIRRRIKNRESARVSRQGKRDGVDELESKVQQHQRKNNELQISLAETQAINASLKNELGFMTKTIMSNPHLYKLYTKVSESNKIINIRETQEIPKDDVFIKEEQGGEIVEGEVVEEKERYPPAIHNVIDIDSILL